ncbi:MAG: HAD family hydrolase [Candidatus Diapherotrites archaeon]
MVRKSSNKKTLHPVSSPYWLVLDMHGVLIPNSEKWILKSVAKGLHLSFPFVVLRWFLNLSDAQRGKLGAKSFYERILERKLTEKEFAVWIMHRYIRRAVIDPRIVEQLMRLKKKGWKIALLSDMNTAQAAYHRDVGHVKLFDEAFISCETGLMKPFPSVYEAMEHRLRARKDHIVFVDDWWFNSWGASLMGWRGITLKHGSSFLRFLMDLE